MERIQIRAEDSVKKKIKSLADAVGMNISQFMLTKALGQEINLAACYETTQKIKVITELLTELKRWGNNLNQLSKGINQANLEGKAELNNQLQRDIREMKNSINQLKSEIKDHLEIKKAEQA